MATASLLLGASVALCLPLEVILLVSPFGQLEKPRILARSGILKFCVVVVLLRNYRCIHLLYTHTLSRPTTTYTYRSP